MIRIETNVEFGKKYKDKITDFEGIAISLMKHQFGIIQILLQPKIDKHGDVPDSVWCYEENLIEIASSNNNTTGFLPGVSVESFEPKRVYGSDESVSYNKEIEFKKEV